MWIVATLYLMIVCALGLIVWWEFQRNRKRSRPTPERETVSKSLPVE